MTDDSLDEKIQFGIWDTAGSERYKALAPMYYRGAEVAIVVSVKSTCLKWLEGAKNWVRDLKLYGQPNVASMRSPRTSRDLDAQFREVSAQEGQAYARDEDMAYFLRRVRRRRTTSAPCSSRAKRVPRTKDASLRARRSTAARAPPRAEAAAKAA